MENSAKIKSILKAIDLLEELSKEGEGVSLTELSQKLNYYTSITYQLLNTLASRGYVGRHNDLYRIGPEILRLQALTKQNTQLSQIAHPFLINLRDKTGFTASLAIRDDLQAIPIRIVKGSVTLVVNSNLGETIPLYAPSLGKCLLAFLPNHEQERIIEKLKMEPLTTNTITN